MRWWIYPVMFFALNAAPTFAASDVDWRRCMDLDNEAEVDANIAACTRILARGETQIAQASALSNRCELWNEKGDNNRALADCNESLRLNPTNASAHIHRGNAWLGKGDNDRAFREFDEATRLDPKNAVAYNNRCFARAIMGRDLPEAFADCNESLRLKPGYANAFNSLGLLHLKLGAFDEAIMDYNSAIARNPKDADSLYGRGIAERKSGDTAGGDSDIAAATAIRPDIGKVYAGYGVK
jgi:tetratricopeptide (TPR) repeat protein